MCDIAIQLQYSPTGVGNKPFRHVQRRGLGGSGHWIDLSDAARSLAGRFGQRGRGVEVRTRVHRRTLNTGKFA
jgi:hypothetical protein